jgi:hypothetical protein
MVETDKLHKRRWQFGLLLALMTPMIGGLLTLLPHGEKVGTAEVHAGATLSQHLLQSGSGVTASGVPAPKFPPNYKEAGTVDDRYSVAVDPKTGETVIHDALGGVGTNNTSVEGDRARLAKDMLTLEEYANTHKGSLKPQDYNWLKRLARAGMKLAFGTPGLPPAMQPPIKANLLAQFHDISAHPTQSLMLSSFFPHVEQAALAPENTYQAMPDSLAAAPDTSVLSASSGSLLGLDPAVPKLMTENANDPSATNSLTTLLSSTLLVPSTTTLVAGATNTPTTTSPTSSSTLISGTTTVSPTATNAPTSLTADATNTSPTPSTSPSLTANLTAIQPNTTLTSTNTATNTATAPITLNTNTSLSTTSGLSASLDLSVTGLSAGTTLTLSPSTTSSTTNTNPSLLPLNVSLTPTTSLSPTTSTNTATSTTTNTTTTKTTTVQDYYNALLAPVK